MVDKPLTPGAEKTAPESSKPLSPGGTQSSPGVGGAPSPPLKAASSPKSAGVPPSLKPAESPKTTSPSPRSFGLGSFGGPSLSGDSSVPRVGKSTWWYSQVEESLANDPEFIKVGFHIGRFITAAVDTEEDRTNMDALYTDLESASTRFNVSTFPLIFYNHS
jgi:hypothetical protein